VKKKPVKPYLRKIIKWPICRKALSMRRGEDGKNKNLGYCGPYWGQREKPYRYQTGIFGLHWQARGVVTGIRTQDNSTIARILMTWA
jgi:hypothetical protein